MPQSIVCDAGGVLAASGALAGIVPTEAEFLALDWSAVTVGRFLAARHAGNQARIETEIGLALAVVDEWFPVRTIVATTLDRAGLGAVDALDSWSALVLAEQLALPLFTASDEVSSNKIEIRRPW
ncbi:MAG: hypothetical protein OXE75_14400 [bacterium]|nr:hypothetical protein [bacterium]